MFGSLRAHLVSQLDAIRAEGLWKEERLLASAQGARITVQGRQVLNLCANNYLGLANHPEIVAAAQASLDRWGYGLSSVRFICGTQEIHKELERRLSDFPGNRGHHPLLLLLRRQRRLLRGAARRGGRHHQRRTQSRQHHRRRPPLQGPAFPVQERRPGRSGGALGRSARRALPRHRHRRRLLHGRHHGAAGGDLRSGRAVRGAGHGGRLARDRVRGSERARDPRAARASWDAWTCSPERSARHWAEPAAATPRAAARSSHSCANAPVPTYSPTRCRPPSWPGR